MVSSVFCLVCFPLLLFVRVKKLPGNCKAKSEVLLSSPGCYLEILSVEKQSGEAGSLCPRTKPGLLTDSVFIPLLEILPRLMWELQPATPYHSKPGAVFPPAQSRDLTPNPSFYPPEAQKRQEHSLARRTQESSHPALTEPTCWHQKQALGGSGRL